MICVWSSSSSFLLLRSSSMPSFLLFPPPPSSSFLPHPPFSKCGRLAVPAPLVETALSHSPGWLHFLGLLRAGLTGTHHHTQDVFSGLHCLVLLCQMLVDNLCFGPFLAFLFFSADLICGFIHFNQDALITCINSKF